RVARPGTATWRDLGLAVRDVLTGTWWLQASGFRKNSLNRAHRSKTGCDAEAQHPATARPLEGIGQVHLRHGETKHIGPQRHTGARNRLTGSPQERRTVALLPRDAGICEERHLDWNGPVHPVAHAERPQQR